MLPFSNLTPLTLNSSEPEQFLPSKPLIWVASNTAGADAMLTINGINYQIDNMPVGGVWIDCEKMVVTNFLKTKLKPLKSLKQELFACLFSFLIFFIYLA